MMNNRKCMGEPCFKFKTTLVISNNVPYQFYSGNTVNEASAGQELRFLPGAGGQYFKYYCLSLL